MTKKLKAEELRKLLNDYLLCSGRGPMAVTIEEIVKAYIYDFGLILFAREPAFPQVADVLEKLQIPFSYAYNITEEGYFETILDDDERLPHVRTRHLEIPGYRNREQDWGRIAAYYFEDSVRRLQEHDDNIPSLKVDGALLLIVRALFLSGYHSIEEVVEDAIIDARDGIVIGSDQQVHSRFLREVYYSIAKLPKEALWYLGIVNEWGAFNEIIDSIHHIDHWINKIATDEHNMEFRDERWHGFERKHSEIIQFYPIRVRNVSFRIQDIGTAIRNLSYLLDSSRSSLSEEAQRCLKLRLQGHSEAEIAKTLELKYTNEYRAMLNENGIEIELQASNSVFAAWQSAAKTLLSLDADPTGGPGEFFGCNEITDTARSTKTFTEDEAQVEFNPSPDYTSIIVGTQTFRLSKTQGRVIQLLHEAHPNSLSYASLRADLDREFSLSSNSYTTLRKLFADKLNAYEALVEKIGNTSNAQYRLKLP